MERSGTSRLEAFSDGVSAIAATPLVLARSAARLVAFFSPVASVTLTFAIAAFYLPSAALFDRS